MYKYIYQSLLLVFGIGLFINATSDNGRSLNPVYYNSFGENVLEEIEIGVKKYKKAFSDTDLNDENFYIIFNECEGEKIILINYLNCETCGMRELIESTNRFLKISETKSYPLVTDSDLSHSHFFESDGIRMNPSREGYAVTLDEENVVVSATFADF